MCMIVLNMLCITSIKLEVVVKRLRGCFLPKLSVLYDGMTCSFGICDGRFVFGYIVMWRRLHHSKAHVKSL